MTTGKPETAEIKCPQCSNVSEVRGGEHTFCPTCDFPLFWADPTQSALLPAVQSAAVGEEAPAQAAPEPAEESEAAESEDDIDAQVTDIICRNCALRNPGDRTYCMRCGHELPPPEEWFNPDEPVQVEAEPEQPLWRSLIVPVVALVVVAGVTLGILHFVFDVFSSNPVISVRTIVSGDDSAHSLAILLEGDPPVPVVAYRNNAANSLNLAVCEDLECSSLRTTTAVDTEGSAGLELAMDVISGGPLIVYRRQPTASLIAVNCGTVECDNRTGARGFFAVDESEDVGYAPAMAVTGGVPAVTYSDANGALKLAYLCRESCNESGGVIITDLSATTEPGTPASIAIPRAASPYISFWNPDAQALQLIHCLDVNCEKRAPAEPIELIRGAYGPQTAMLIDGESLSPTVAFRDITNGELVLLSCGDEECTTDERDELAVIDRGARETTDHDVGHDIAMRRGPDGFPVIAYRDETAGELLLAVCTALPCTRETVVVDIVDNGGTGGSKVKVGYGTSMAITGDTAVIAYADEDRASLRIARVDLSRFLKRGAPATASDGVQPTTAPVEQQ